MNTDEIKQWLDYLVELHGQHGGRTEIRTIKKASPPKILGRQYDSVDAIMRALQPAIQVPHLIEGVNIYTTLNPISPKIDSQSCASDPDVEAYLWLPIDVDPIRYERDKFGVEQMLLGKGAKDVPSSDEELQNAAKAIEVIEAMIETATGVKPTVAAMSGNGFHRLYRLAIEDKHAAKMAVHGILKTLKRIFVESPLSSHMCDVDTTVANPARIWKLYGTVAQKGQESETRKFRPSRLISLAPHEHPMTLRDLEKLQTALSDYLLGFVKPEPKLPKPTSNASTAFDATPRTHTKEGWLKELGGHDLMQLDVPNALAAAGHELIDEGEVEGKKCVWIKCPNEAQHTSATGPRDALVYLPRLNADGTRVFAGFTCFHDHCQGMTGAEFTHTRLLGSDIVKRFSPKNPTAEKPKPLPTATSPTVLNPGLNAPEQPEPIRLDRKKVRGLDWMLDPTKVATREVLVPGLLYRGEVMTLAAPTKVGKTFQLMHAALAWSHGEAFLGMEPTKPLRILYIDPELLEDQAQLRLKALSMNCITGKPENRVDYINLRNDPCMVDADPWGVMMKSLKSWLEDGDEWDIIIVDSMYKFQGEMNLNDSGAVVRMLSQLKAVTFSGVQPAIIYVHHYAKGDPGAKKTTDRSAGSFAFSADADAIVTLTPHPKSQEGTDHYNVEFTLRHWPRKDTIVVARRPDIPILDPIEGIEPEIDSVFQMRRRQAVDAICLLEEMILRNVSVATPYEKYELRVREWKKECLSKIGLTANEFDSARKIASDEEWITGGGNGPGKFYRLTESGKHLVDEVNNEPVNQEAPFEPDERPAPEEPAPACNLAGRQLV